MRVFIVAGSPEAQPPLGLRPGPGDYVIAADRGAAHARAWGWPIHLVIGDLDSLSPVDAGALAAQGVPQVVAPTAKDETDLELAIAHALDRDAQEVVICAALGGRTDHLLANVFLLARADLAGRDVCIADGGQTVRLLRGGEMVTLQGTAGDLLTLLPLADSAEGITTSGLAYPLHGETLHLASSRGVSNVFLGSEAQVRLRRGRLLVIHTQMSSVTIHE